MYLGLKTHTSRAPSFVVVVVKENNTPGARNVYAFRAPSLVVVIVVAVKCYGGGDVVPFCGVALVVVVFWTVGGQNRWRWCKNGRWWSKPGGGGEKGWQRW